VKYLFLTAVTALAVFVFHPTAVSAGTAVAVLPTVAQPSQSTVTVYAKTGPVRGFRRDGVSTFLGIPYAAPPIDERRWKPPAPAASHGLLDATKFGSSCPQLNPYVVFTAGQSVDENCLTLNIFTAGVGPSDGRLKPVIVWIHGGGNISGASADYDGSALARGGAEGTPTVVVTINYRLGLFGFLAHPALKSEGGLFANYGIMDQQTALRWVQANIRAFGGDPARVAVGGQSAGAGNALAHLVSPLSSGLLSRAIFMSGPAAAGFSPVPLDEATGRGQRFAAAAGCPGSDYVAARCLRRLSPARILQLQGTIKDYGPYLDPGDQVIADGTIIPLQAAEALATGRFNHMPVMGGMTRDEPSFLIGMQQYFSGPPPGSTGAPFAGPPQRPLSAEDYAAKLMSFGPLASRILTQYPVAKYGGDAGMAYNRAIADRLECTVNLSGLKLLARTVSAYGWDFTYQDAPFYMPHMPGFRASASHTIDIQFLFKDYHGGPLGVNLDQFTGMPRELNALETHLSERMIGFWTNFAARGNPNQPGRQDWPQLDPAAPVLLVQDIPASTVSEAKFRTQYNCDFWDSLQTT
jgi:para-nitrobenzyl esterase